MKRDGGRKVMLTETIAVGQGHSADVMALDRGTRGFEKCARCQGQLIGGDEGRGLIAGADAWIKTQGIASPETMAGMLVPGVYSR